MSADRMPRDAIKLSFWQFDPTTEEEATEVEAMESGGVVHRSDDDRVLLSVRGKPNGRYEVGDSLWLEFTDGEALRLIGQLARVLGQELKL